MATAEQAPSEDLQPATASASPQPNHPDKSTSNPLANPENDTPNDQPGTPHSDHPQTADEKGVKPKRRKVSFGPVQHIETEALPAQQAQSDEEEDDDYAPSDGEYADEDGHGIPPEEFASAMAEISSMLKGRLQSFIDSGKLGSKPLHAAAAANDVEKLKQLLAPDGECNGYINDVDVFQYNALHVAAERGCVEACQLLVQCGIDKNATTSMHQSTALHYAAFEGHDEVIDVLLGAGIHVDVVTDDGRTALYQAAMRGHAECVELLLKNGADPLAKTKDDKTPVQVATGQEIIELLEQPPQKKARTQA